MSINFSDEVIAGLERREKVYCVYDECTTGLHVRVLLSGVKMLLVSCSLLGRTVNVALGAFGDVTYKVAREKAVEIRAKLKACRNQVEVENVIKAYRRKGGVFNESWSKKNNAVRALMVHINSNNLPLPHIDILIKEESNLIFGLVWPNLNIAIDVIPFNQVNMATSKTQELVGRHNAATLLGWDVYLVTPAMVYDGSAIDLISSAIKSKVELSHAAQG